MLFKSGKNTYEFCPLKILSLQHSIVDYKYNVIQQTSSTYSSCLTETSATRYSPIITAKWNKPVIKDKYCILPLIWDISETDFCSCLLFRFQKATNVGF